MSRKEYIDILTSCSKTLQEEYGITSMRLFGSIARDEQRSDSDVDVFVKTLTTNPFLSAINRLEERTECIHDVNDFLGSSNGMILLDATCMLLNRQ